MKISETIFVSDKSDVPECDHWAIFLFSSITIPGDERSRTNPGHGYPEHSVSRVEYRAYLSETAWKKEIIRLEGLVWKTPYYACKVTPAKIKTAVSVEVEIK